MNSYKHTCFLIIGLWLLLLGCDRRRSQAQCYDGVQNGNEAGVDCGGVCRSCYTCYDSIQNQDETAVDCGGVCGSCSVTYPKSGLYGTNILRIDGVNIVSGNSCSASAEVSANGSIRVVIKNTSEDDSNWSYRPQSIQGWIVEPYNQTSKTQQLLAVGKKSCQLELIFAGDGSADIDIYENGANTPSSKRTIWWH